MTFKCATICKGVKLIFTEGHISITAALKLQL